MMKQTIRNTPLPDTWDVYAETPNGSEIREARVGKRTLYFVQPKNDNYWICTLTPTAALRAYYHPERFR